MLLKQNKSKNIRISIAQLSSYPRERLRWMIRKASHSSDLLLLPEAFSSGFQFGKLEQTVEENRLVLDVMQENAQEYSIAVAGSLFLRDTPSGKIFNQGIFIDRSGEIIHRYAKQNIISVLGEDKFIQPGSPGSVFLFEGIRVGMAICYDLRFPEVFREYTRQNADLFLLPMQWPSSRLEHYTLLAKARALENQTFLVSANSLQGESGGHSMVVDARGDIIVNLKKKTTISSFTLDFEEQNRYRKEFPARKEFLAKNSG